MIDYGRCNKEIYERGNVVGVYQFSKDEMHSICEKANHYNGVNVDWHYSGGRPIVKTLGDVYLAEYAINDVIKTNNFEKK